MTLKKSFLIPIYGIGANLVIADSIEDLIRQYNRQAGLAMNIDETKCEAYTFFDHPNLKILFKTEAVTHENLAHEIDHIVHCLFREIGIKDSDESDEAFAYLTGWLHKKVYQILAKNKVAITH